MAAGYVPVDRDQLFLLPPDMKDWLPEDHLAWFVIDTVAAIDTSAFFLTRPNDGVGRPAYHPEMMVALLFYAYCCGLRSSRAIERACRFDVSFRVICGLNVPDHATIARFRAENEDAIRGAFVEVLRLCHMAGIASLGTLALDGTKIAANAALDKNRSEEWIRSQIDEMLAEAAAADAGKPVPQRLVDDLGADGELRLRPGRAQRLARLRGALLEIEAEKAEIEAAEAERASKAAEEARAGRRLRGRKPKDPKAALLRARADLAAAETRAKANPGSAKAEKEVTACRSRLESAEAKLAEADPRSTKANVTDPESRIMKSIHGFLQGFNLQVVVNKLQVAIGYQLTNDCNDVAQLVPMMALAEESARAASITEEIGTVLADAGYCSEPNLTAPGPDRLVATKKDWRQRRAARELGETSGPPPEDASPVDRMEHRLRTKEGAELYSLRSHTVEPVFGNAKENLGFDRFSRRGLLAGDAEAGLFLISNNLLKIFRLNPGSIRLAI